MTFWQRARFALWFCRRDLFEVVARPVSWTVVLAVALAAAASCVALALPWVTTEIRLRRLAQSPWARSIWVSSKTALDERFTDERLARLDAAARVKIPGAGPDAIAVSGFHDVHLNFFMLQSDEVLRSRRGRTVAANDPLLPALPRLLRNGSGFDGSGIILSPELVERLGGSPGDPPKEVRIETPETGRVLSWKVAAVFHDPLPLGHDFMLTEKEDEKLRAADTEVPQAVVWSGPLGPRWPRTEWLDFPLSVQRAALDFRLQVIVGRRLDRQALQLTAEAPLRAKEWSGYLQRFERLLDDEGLGEAPGFVAIEPDRPHDPPPPPKRDPYRRATIYVKYLEYLRPAADAARGMDLHANDAARALVDEIRTTADQAKAVVIGLVAAFCLAGFVALGLALFLRGRQKAAQVGMLRAMGADGRVLRTIVMTEAAVLWIVGTAIGLVVALAVGVGLCWKYEVTAEELRAAAGTGWWAVCVVVFLVVSLAGCALGNRLATRGVRHRPAAESLGLTS